MANKIYLKDEDLENLFKVRIIQYDNPNANAELFICNDIVIKIYYGNSKHIKFNINVINNIFSKLSFFRNINELVLPKDLIIYNNNIVGFSMPYVNGTTLEEIINKKIYTEYDMKKIFINLLSIINKFNNLPFRFFIGDMHEKNIIIDKNGKINIIDSDTFIIDNNKLCIDGEYLVGKYVNHFYNNSELEKIQISADYYSLLCIILNYVFKDIIEDVSEPVNWLKNNSQFKQIYPILNRVDENFILSEDDINRIFNFKDNLKYKYKDNNKLLKKIKKIRKLSNKE